ncbi:MAG: hypothetical protein NVSMB6_32650 [Burkholderiaceae bacterium]
MKLLSHLLSMVLRPRATAAHDDNLRAGGDAPMRLVQSNSWNSMLL